MKKYQEIKQARQDATNKLFTDCQVFWAFSNEQFQEGLAKTKLQPNEKLVSIGAGGYIPKGNLDALLAGMKTIKDNFRQATKDAKTRQEHILYELNNHEAFYTNSIEDTLDALGEDYTTEEVTTVYKEYKKAKYKEELTNEELQAKYI